MPTRPRAPRSRPPPHDARFDARFMEFFAIRCVPARHAATITCLSSFLMMRARRRARALIFINPVLALLSLVKIRGAMALLLIYYFHTVYSRQKRAMR